MTTNPNGFMVVQNSTDESQLLGKFLYYSLADVLVQKEDFEHTLKELEDAGLILRVRQGVGEPNRIYVLIPGKEDAALA